MKRFFTADLHLNHANIVKYCNRPYLHKGDLDDNGNWVSNEAALACAERMNVGLIHTLNSRIKPEDQVIHVGDFMNRGSVKGVEGLKVKPINHIDELNGHWTLLSGNHDRNNGVKPIARYMIINIGPYIAFVSHYPIENMDKFEPELMNYILNCTSFQICGHVHTAWKYKFYNTSNKRYLMYNVGIDAHKLMPIHDAEIIGDVEKIKKQ